MSDYDGSISRTDATPLINEEVIKEIIKEVPLTSTTMKLMRKLPNASKNQVRIPVLDSLASAYFLTGEGGDGTGTSYQRGQKKVTALDWANEYIYIEELAAIIPIATQVLDDSDYDIWSEVKPELVAAIARAVDAAVIFGTNKPSTWPNGIVTDSTTKSTAVTEGSVGKDLYDDIFATGGMLDLIRKLGYYPTGYIAGMGMESKLDGLRTTEGKPIFDNYQQQEGQYRLKGKPLLTDLGGVMDAGAASALMIAGDWSKAVYSIRQDLTFDIAKEASLFDSSGNLVYNLFQQDMVALRVTMRLGWQLPNPVNPIQTTAGTRYPFSILVPA